LTEKEAVEKAARALAEIDCRTQADLRTAFKEPMEDLVACVNKDWPGYVNEARAALRAAGVRFREEA
jgi:hypothetical protein